MFIYVPATKPDPPSPLRQLAYQENSPLLGPDGDPEGWKVFPSVKIRGRIFSARDVELRCTVRDAYHYPCCPRSKIIDSYLSPSQ